MRHMLKQISQLERQAARLDDLGRERFSQAKVSLYQQGELMDQGIAYKLSADQLRLKAAKLLLDTPVVVGPREVLSAEC
ncbi:MAG: hypothetical protein IID41_07225 [Planctomycetes bacterium]|nr:hypothetical protein [Planctomycetota bacterium]